MIPFAVIAVLILLYVIRTNPAHAVERITVPETFPQHPRLFMNQDEIDRLKAWIESEIWARDRISDFVKQSLQDADRDYTPGKLPNVEIADKARDMSFAFVLSGEEKLSQKVAEILLAFADVYPSYPITVMRGRATSATLHESPWAVSLATAYDFIYSSGVLSDDDKVNIENNVFRPCAEVLRICNHWTKSNWRACALAGLGIVGFCIGEQEFMEEALNGYYNSSGELERYGFAQHVAESILADGIFYERSLGYHLYTLSSYVKLAEVARHSGIDLWHTEITGNQGDAGSDQERRWGATGKKTMKMMFDAPFYYVFPNFSGAAVADSNTYHLSPDIFYELAYGVYKDEKYAWLLNRAKQPRRPDSAIDMMWFNPEVPQGRFGLSDDSKFAINGIHKNACTIFPSGGYSILRDSAAEDAISVLMTYGKYGSGHDHPDKMHISLYGAGKIIAPDAGSLGYGNQDHLTWAKQTIGHNTVTVDEVAQHPQGASDSMWEVDTEEKPSVGRPLLFYAGEHLKAMRADCDNAYEGVILDRTVALVDSCIFDFYRVRSKEEHQYDYALHIDGELSDSSMELNKKSGALSSKLGYAHITDIQRGDMGQNKCDITYAIPLSENGSDTVPLQLTFLPISAGEVILGDGLKEKDKDKGKSVAIIRTHAANTDFVTVMKIDTSPESNFVVKRLQGMPEGVICLEIGNLDGKKSYLVSAEKPQRINIAGTEVDGQLALVCVDENDQIEIVETAK